MSKRFENKTCVYCGRESSSGTGDHVFAREFFLLDKRQNLPQVPACHSCNNAKSILEHYLASILPFGARHTDAAVNLADMVPPRLAKNAKLHRQLASEKDREWVEERGILFPCIRLPINSKKLEGLFRFIVRGLLWHHWKVVLTEDHFVGAGTLTSFGESMFEGLLNKNANNRIKVDLGDGTIQYEGVQGIDIPQLSIWKFTIYGGLKLGGDVDAPGEYPSFIWGLTCRNALRPDFWTE